MANRKCSGCGRRLPYALKHCRSCGPAASAGEPPRLRRYAGRLVALVAALLVLGVVVQGLRRPGELADWYAEFAFERLPAGFSAFGPNDTPTGAFYYCVQRVAQRVRDGHSVETFPSSAESETQPLPDGRYRVRSYVDKQTDAGETIRQDFTCVARYDAGRWRLEELALAEASRRLADAAAPARE